MRCNAGDIAIITKPSLPQNMGALVEIERYRGNGFWRVRALRGPMRRSDGVESMTAELRDDCLSPIRAAGREHGRAGSQRQLTLELPR